MRGNSPVCLRWLIVMHGVQFGVCLSTILLAAAYFSDMKGYPAICQYAHIEVWLCYVIQQILGHLVALMDIEKCKR